MKIATWNVNSIRTRLDHVIEWLTDNPVDVLCLQETKVIEEWFPRLPFTKLGYYLYVSGQKSYNGVAIASLQPLTDSIIGFNSILPDLDSKWDEQKRVITGMLADICIVNLYVPNGSSVGSNKYEYKLKWLHLLGSYLQKLMQTHSHICMCGDFNIALEDRDIHEKVNNKNHIMSSSAERQALKSILSLGFADAFRKFNQESGQYSWWDYRAASFQHNFGWRIDHHYLTPELYNRAKGCITDTIPRNKQKPSDHAPVILEI
ncbi:Exodeoxyribonuclease III [Richelia intracellularis HH01]|jgi:exodeoxyribonuclease-3|uniref:Exodeoxyribonuclease III n=1 Tax=Richelia intracellularis HH01 TaxID=1165094 RepID=M1WSE4_9NOST|nr:exodeoxyribonuclease III [Richelia intracellularis]CCH67404.1 Exodeoxyribonuclease III [Richelia intracellularis HH01]